MLIEGCLSVTALLELSNLGLKLLLLNCESLYLPLKLPLMHSLMFKLAVDLENDTAELLIDTFQCVDCYLSSLKLS